MAKSKVKLVTETRITGIEPRVFITTNGCEFHIRKFDATCADVVVGIRGVNREHDAFLSAVDAREAAEFFNELADALEQLEEAQQ